MEGEADHHQVVVTEYFGELLEEVAKGAPVSHDRLVKVLAAVNDAAHRQDLRTDDRTRVLHDGPTETVVAAPPPVWETITADTRARERQTAGECHRRMAVALGADSGGQEVPIVLPDPADG